MAASIKISELNSLTALTDVDLFLVSDMETGTSRKISYNNLKSNVITDTASALSSLEGIVSQNKTAAETLVETVRAALQAGIDSNATNFDLADDGLETRLVVLEADPTTQTSLNSVNQSLTTSIGTLAGDVTQNTTDISALQTTVANLDIDIAPETLNTIDELATALGDDPAFLSTLQSRLTVIENDNATQTELDAVNQSIQVSLGSLTTAYTDADALKLNIADPVFTGIISGPDIDIGNGNLTVASSGGVVSNVGFFSSGMLSIGGNASFTGNASFSGGSFNLLNGFKISNTAVTASADELNYVTGVTSSIQTQLTALQTSITNLDIDIAPETLDSINELAAAMGDDPAFLTTLQGRVTTIEGDIATQTELNTYKAEIEDRNLQLALAYDTPLFVELLNAG